MAYSLGVAPSDEGSEPVGGGGCRLVSSFFTLLIPLQVSQHNVSPS